MSFHLTQRMALIVQAVASGQYRYTVHGAQQRIARNIHGHEVEAAIASGEIIEHYPQHRYGPACLILGWTRTGRPIDIVCSVQPIVAIITVYEPNLTEWEADLRTRRI